MKTTTPLTESLPAELMPPISSIDLIRKYIQRIVDGGGLQRDIARAIGFSENYISILKTGEKLAPARVLAFATAARLSDDERIELLHARIVEEHGGKPEFCVHTMTQWAMDLCGSIGDEALLIDWWRDAVAPAPAMLQNILNKSEFSSKIRGAMIDAAQTELRSMADHPE